VNTAHSSTAQTGEESVERKLEVRATASRERGRDGTISRGTAGSARREDKLIAWATTQ
jgi:hypothetical protein